MATAIETSAHDGLSIGRVFDRALSTIKHNPVVTLLLALLFGTIPALLVSYVSGSLVDQTQDVGMQFWIMILFTLILGMFISAITQAVLTRATVAESEGRRAGFGESVRAAMEVVVPMLALGILYSVAVSIGLVLLIIPGLMLMVTWYVATPALVEERQGIFAAFQRSADLTDGARWPIFGLFLVAALSTLLQEWAVEAISGEIDTTTMAGAFNNPLYLVASAIFGTLLNVLWSTVQASLYIELRDWKDGPATNRLEQIFA